MCYSFLTTYDVTILVRRWRCRAEVSQHIVQVTSEGVKKLQETTITNYITASNQM
jgi:hypothetical protein